MMNSEKQPIIGDHYFSQASAECQLTFEHGCYFACISLCQSLAEAYSRFLYEKWTTNDAPESFGARIHKIELAKVMPEVSKLLTCIYGEKQRQDFHHLNKSVPTDYQELKTMATEKIKLLNKIETQVWECYNTREGLDVKYPQYWTKKNGFWQTYLRFEP